MRISPTLVVAAIMLSSSAVTNAQTLPAYMAPISGKTAAAPSDIAIKNMLALNTGMFELYGDAAKIFQKNILSRHPVILGLFSGAGGRMILYRPGMAPIDARVYGAKGKSARDALVADVRAALESGFR